MQNFIELFKNLDSLNSTNRKLILLKEYFKTEKEENLDFAIYLLSGKKRKKLVSTKLLKELLLKFANLDEWVFEECYAEVGDFAETVNLLLPISYNNLANCDLKRDYISLTNITKLEDKINYILQCWQTYNFYARFLFNKIISGTLRIGVSDGLVIKALSEVFSISPHSCAQILMGNWNPTSTTICSKLKNNNIKPVSTPYPFCLAQTFDKQIEPTKLSEWIIEKKYDGIRCQIIKRNNEVYIWSRGEEILNEQFPDLIDAFQALDNGTVIDGELLAYTTNFEIDSFNKLQKRLNKKNPSKKLILEIPCFVIAYDILEFNGKDIRFYPLKERKLILSELCKSKTISLLKISEEYTFKNWDEVVTFKSTCKRNHCEGLMFKKIDEIYVSGKRVNSWIKWKFQPYTLDAILLYAQKGRGKRSGLYTDYSFGLWNNNELVPFAKAYSGLSNKEIHELNQWIKQNTLEKFGTVRLVKPQHVFEIAFEGINISKRHKSGFAVRFPRILRWRKDKLVHEANHIEDLKKLIENQF